MGTLSPYPSLSFLFVQTKAHGVKSVISKMSNSKADLLVENGDKIYFGDLYLEVRQSCIMLVFCKMSRESCILCI